MKFVSRTINYAMKLADEPFVSALFIIIIAYTSLVATNPNQKIENSQYIFNSIIDDTAQTNASHHLYPYLASAVTIAVLVALVMIIAIKGSTFNSDV